jgi:hypothetical protein
MNIFILSHELESLPHHLEQAKYHCDRHVVKMILESTQMLVTALPSFPGLGICQDSYPCKPLASGHAKHPCSIWVKQDVIHLNYLSLLAFNLCLEHQYRWPLAPRHAYFQFLGSVVHKLALQGLGYKASMPSSFAVAVKSESLRSTNCPHEQTVEIYRDYYVTDKIKFASWKKRMKPMWFLLREEANI